MDNNNCTQIRYETILFYCLLQYDNIYIKLRDTPTSNYLFNLCPLCFLSVTGSRGLVPTRPNDNVWVGMSIGVWSSAATYCFDVDKLF